MLWMLDTSVAIPLRENDLDVAARIGGLEGDLVVSAVTRVELENGVYRDPALSQKRRALLDLMLETVLVLPFDDQCAACFGQIVAQLGWSRTQTIDRMIAATAIVNHMPLITFNGRDFRKIAGLELVEWETPNPHPPSEAPQ
jgi:tRNA(fMet)-specific endonuclease VapC